jgi:predicted ATPase
MLHWADPTSLEVFSEAVDRTPARRVLLIITFRPEVEPPWIGQPHVTALTINRLTPRDVEAMIDRVIGNRQLAANVRQEIIERTDGVPLFVEEMTKAVLEAESPSAAERTAAAVPAAAMAVPATLHASLMARLDRLGGPAKEVAQISAAIGREFSHALLAAVMQKPEAELRSSLNRLVAAGLLFRQGIPPHATYLFKHALVQDAAYGTLLREPRRGLHANIADTLQNQFAEIAENQPEVLARHCTEAGLTEKAARLWGKARPDKGPWRAQPWLKQSSSLRARLPRSPRYPPRPNCVAKRSMHVKGYAAPETKAAAERARLLIENAEALGDTPEDPLPLCSVLYSLWGANFMTFNGDLCRDLAADVLSLAEKQGDVVALMTGHNVMGTSLLFTGEIAEGRLHLDQTIALYDPAQHRQLATRIGQDVRVTVFAYRAIALWLLGYPNAALADAERMLEDAREIDQAATLMYALVHASFIYLFCGKYAAGNTVADECVALAEEKNAEFWKAGGISLKARIFAESGKASDAVHAMTSTRNRWRSTGSRTFAPSALSSLSSAYADLGQFEEAWRCINAAMTTMETTKERWSEAEVHRLAGEIALKSPEPDAAKAEMYFERALAVARKQQAKSWELRAAMSLARLWRSQGKTQQARELLAPVYGWFTEGFDTLDLKEAKALLEELAS